jgi:predicted outer membrane protein
MSKIRFVVATFAIASLCGLSTGQAQQVTLPPTDVSPGTPAQPAQLPGQPAQIDTQPLGTQTVQDDRYEARRVTNDSNSQQGQTLKEAIVQKLRKANEAEIELAKMAMEKTNNKDVRELTKTIVQDHQAFNQKLKQMSGKQDEGTVKHDEGNRTQGSSENATGGNRKTGQTLTNNQSPIVPAQLSKLAEQACDNALDMTKEMLSQYEGQDFNMAFLGQQCVAHITMLAELKAIESAGPQELQQVAQEAAKKVEQHLEKCKQLAKKLEDDRKNTRS